MFQKSEEINAFGFHGEFTKDDANTAFWITLVSVVLQILSSAKGGAILKVENQIRKPGNKRTRPIDPVTSATHVAWP